MSHKASEYTLNIFEDLKTLLKYYQELGLDRIPVILCEPEKSHVIAAPCKIPKSKGTEELVKNQYSDKSTVLQAFTDKEQLLARLSEYIGDCSRCKLFKYRKNIVFGVGTPGARLMFIGEAPGKEEDVQGVPFVGEAGMLLTRLIEKMGLSRDNVYIANIIKCRPPMNRDPEEDEIAACKTFLDRQIAIINPEIIITLGRIALQTLMNTAKIKITALRGSFFEYDGIPVMPTFHPAYLLRNPKDKWKTWADAQKVMERLERKNGNN